MNRIHVSHAAYNYLAIENRFNIEYRGEIEMKVRLIRSDSIMPKKNALGERFTSGILANGCSKEAKP